MEISNTTILYSTLPYSTHYGDVQHSFGLFETIRDLHYMSRSALLDRTLKVLSSFEGLKRLIPNFGKEQVHQNIFSHHKSKPYCFLSFFCAPWQDFALINSIKICSLSLIVLSKIKVVGIVSMQMVVINEFALFVTHDTYVFIIPRLCSCLLSL